jgi:protein phosphatase
MGGHEGGSVASSQTLHVFEKEFYKRFPKNESLVHAWFKSTVKKSKEAMVKAAKNNKKLLDMGTTLTCAIFLEKNILIFNIGDSRTYVYNGLLHQVTTDHNLRNYYMQDHNLSPEKASHVIGGSALTSALGPNKKTIIDAFEIDNDPDIKYIILTSDGIHDYISKPFFEKTLLHTKSNQLETITSNIIKKSIEGESNDNLTIAIVEVN